MVFFILMASITLRAVTQYAQVRFALMREYSIGSRLIESYLHQPYLWFLQRNTGDFLLLGAFLFYAVSTVQSNLINAYSN